jgi:hypothetical protein
MKITTEEARAILAVKDGADVYDNGLARVLRGLERRGVKGLVDIGAAQAAPANGAERQPYFGAIATKAGLVAARNQKSKAV